MKKIFTLILFSAVFTAILSAKDFKNEPLVAPEFTVAKATVFDITSLKKLPKDNVRFVSQTVKTNIEFAVYYYDAKNNDWAYHGSALLKGNGDTCFPICMNKEKVKNHRFWAVVSKNGDFELIPNSEHHDLYIYVR